MTNIAIVGIGFMGMIHYLSYQKVRGAKVMALCEKIKKRLSGDWRDIQGNFGPTGKKMDLRGVDTYDDLDKMLDNDMLRNDMLKNDRIDLVDVCLPPSMHANAVIKALKAGKHVFCEKPIALKTAEARQMVDAAKKARKLLMIGHVLPLFPEFAFAYKTVASGKYGKLLGGNFKRIISDPLWLKDFYDPARIGGPMLDLHIHDAHFIRLLFGMPTAVSTQGRMRGRVAEYFNTQFQFKNRRLTVTATSGVVNQQGRPFTHGYEIHLEGATLLFEFAVVGDKPQVLMPCTVLTGKGRVIRPKLGSGDPLDAFQTEMAEVTKAVRTLNVPKMLSAQLAYDALVLCQKQTQSLKTGRPAKI